MAWPLVFSWRGWSTRNSKSKEQSLYIRILRGAFGGWCFCHLSLVCEWKQNVIFITIIHGTLLFLLCIHAHMLFCSTFLGCICKPWELSTNMKKKFIIFTGAILCALSFIVFTINNIGFLSTGFPVASPPTCLIDWRHQLNRWLTIHLPQIDCRRNPQ